MGHQAAGNMTNDAFHTYTYDAEGNFLTVDNGSTASYVYDALNRRIRAQIPPYTYEYLFDYAGRRTSSWLNPSAGNPGVGNEGRIYWDGQQIAFRAQDGTTYFEQQNYLGSERLRTNYTGAVAGTYFSLPWGDGSTTTNGGTGANQDTYFFAGLDADTTGSGAQMTDHAQFRNYSFSQGRWLSPDPYDGSYDITNPQSLNRYAYALNNPLSFLDRLGLDPCPPSPVSVDPGDPGDPGDPDDPDDPDTARIRARPADTPCDCGPNCTGVLADPPTPTPDPDPAPLCEDCWIGYQPIQGFLMGAQSSGNSQNAPKSPARKQCEKNALQQLQNTQATVALNLLPNAESSAGEGLFFGAVGGCVAAGFAASAYSEGALFWPACRAAAPAAGLASATIGAIGSYAHSVLNLGIAQLQYQFAMNQCAKE